MLICWLIGHRLDYDIKKPELIMLACTRCGHVKVLYEVRVEVEAKKS
jgi:hypothetical protein